MHSAKCPQQLFCTCSKRTNYVDGSDRENMHSILTRAVSEINNGIAIFCVEFNVSNVDIKAFKVQRQMVRRELPNAIHLNAARLPNLLHSNHDATIRLLFYQVTHCRKICTIKNNKNGIDINKPTRRNYG